MKAILLILIAAVFVSAQSLPPTLEWKLIREMSGEINDHPGIEMKMYAAQIQRGDEKIKLTIKAEFPQGAPTDIFKGTMPSGFDISSIQRVEGQLELNCRTLIVKPIKASAYVYQFNGKRHKTKEPPFAIGLGHILESYFCERGSAPTKPPILKP